MKTIKYILAGVFTITFLVSCDTYYDGYAYRRNPNRYDNFTIIMAGNIKTASGQAKKYMVDLQRLCTRAEKKYYRYDD